MDAIRLTGTVLSWDEDQWDEITIQPDEAMAYEIRGYAIVAIDGVTIATQPLVPADGDIQIQPKSDMRGRLFSGGGHTNAGYSGYFKGYIYLQGKRKRLVNWWTLFPNEEHHYAAQQDRLKTEAAITDIIIALAGAKVTKVKGGYAFVLDRDTA